MQFIHSNKKYIERTMYPINPFMNGNSSEFPSVLNDGNTLGLYDFTDIKNIVIDSNNRVSLAKKLIGSTDLVQSSSNKMPLYVNDSILFDTKYIYLGSESSIIISSLSGISFYLINKNVNDSEPYETDGGFGPDNAVISKNKVYSGGYYCKVNNNQFGVWQFKRAFFSTNKLKFRINAGLESTQNLSRTQYDLFNFGLGRHAPSGGANYQNVKFLLIRIGEDSQEISDGIYNYYKNKYNL